MSHQSIIVVDATTRRLECFAASATCRNGNQQHIILRKAVVIGTIAELRGRVVESPILVVGSYSARSSAGHTTPLGEDNFPKVVWIGGAGFGFDVYDEAKRERRRVADGLRPFGRPLTGTLLPAGTKVEGVQTHSNSNPDTADAAMAGLRIVAETKRQFILTEGQSDYTSAYTFCVAEDAEQPSFPEEHRTDVFSPESMFRAAFRRICPRQRMTEQQYEAKKALELNVMRAAFRAGNAAKSVGFPQQVVDAVGDTELRRIADELGQKYLDEGYQVGFDMSLSNHFTRCVSPNGAQVDGAALFGSPKVEEEFLGLSTLNSDDEKREMRTSNLSNRLGQYFWYEWGTKAGVGTSSMYDHDMLVEAEFDGEAEPTRLWFAHGEKLGPNGEANNGHRYLSAFDAQGHHLWNRLLEMEKMTIKAYSQDGQVVAQRVWESEKDPGCGTPAYPWMASAEGGRRSRTA